MYFAPNGGARVGGPEGAEAELPVGVGAESVEEVPRGHNERVVVAQRGGGRRREVGRG